MRVAEIDKISKIFRSKRRFLGKSEIAVLLKIFKHENWLSTDGSNQDSCYLFGRNYNVCCNFDFVSTSLWRNECQRNKDEVKKHTGHISNAVLKYMNCKDNMKLVCQRNKYEVKEHTGHRSDVVLKYMKRDLWETDKWEENASLTEKI